MLVCRYSEEVHCQRKVGNPVLEHVFCDRTWFFKIPPGEISSDEVKNIFEALSSGSSSWATRAVESEGFST